MHTDQAVPSLMFVTLAIALIIAVVALAAFLRHRRNRHPMAGEPHRNVGKEIDEGRRGEATRVP